MLENERSLFQRLSVGHLIDDIGRIFTPPGVVSEAIQKGISEADTERYNNSTGLQAVTASVRQTIFSSNKFP